MKSETLTVQSIFQDRRQYRVPFYQRSYVWNREDQWQRLWEDIQDKALTRLEGGRAHPHFLGAVVLEPQLREGILGVEQFHIIDGQQRLTTLQYVLTGLFHALSSLQVSALIPPINACLWNSNPETMRDREVERFKLWPTFRDREQFISAMTAESAHDLRQRFPDSFTRIFELRKIGMRHSPALEAIWFFMTCFKKWITSGEDQERLLRAEALTTAILSDLSAVCIFLGEDDDAQVIFETLNGHGAELKATDLIRNFIFMMAGLDADHLYRDLWQRFETNFWSEAQKRGRLNGPRLQWFFHSALQAETADDIDVGRLYVNYRRFAGGGSSAKSARQQLEILNRYAAPYEQLVSGSGSSPIAVFGRRVESWDVSTIHPFALRIAVSGLPEREQSEIFDAIESYLVRRAVCGLTIKNYNKVFAQLLKRSASEVLDSRSIKTALSESTSDAARWPTDEEFRKAWIEAEIFPGNIEVQARLRYIFHRLETAMRTERSEERVLLDMGSLDIDHILPKDWARYWPLSNGEQVTPDELEAAKPYVYSPEQATGKIADILIRNQHVPRFGNLTLAHYGANRSMQNREFAMKREVYRENTNLQLNRSLILEDAWDEAAISKRGEALFAYARRIWTGPEDI